MRRLTVQEATDQPYGVRDCAFRRDPAGNLIGIQDAGLSRPMSATGVRRLGLIRRKEVLRDG